MRVTSVFPTRTFKLIVEFDKTEYRILDIKKFLQDDKGLLADVRDDLDLFMSVSVDDVAGTVSWSNGVDFDPEVIYLKGKDIDNMLDVV